MSRTPPVPDALRPLAPGYTARQVAIDAEMVALGRPALTLRAAIGALAVRRTSKEPQRGLRLVREGPAPAEPATPMAEHQAAVEAWEYANPEAAARWLELRAEAKAEEAKLYAERYGPEAFQREQMRVAGFEEPLVVRAMRELRDSACFHAARDWMLDGTQWCLVLMGAPGCGKSQAATWAAHQLLTRNFPPRCARCPKVSEQPLYGMEAEEYRWRCAQAGVLVLDDLGEGEQRNEKRAAWRAWVDDVLTQRHAARRKTIITTNRTTAELGAWLGARLVDRLNEGTVMSTAEKSMRGVQPTEAP